MDEDGFEKTWKVLSFDEGYKMLIRMGMEELEARVEALKGISIMVISSIPKN